MTGETTAPGGAGTGTEAVERAELYGLLSAVFRAEPTAELLARLRRPELAQALAGAGVDAGRVAAEMAGAGATEALVLEYTRLFLGPGPHVSPHESVHRPDEGAHMGASTVRTQRFIESSGVAFSPAYDGLPDHVSVELEFMAALARAEAAANEGGDEAQRAVLVENQRRFLAEHLGGWVGAFADRVAAGATMAFYREFASLAARFVESETRAAPAGGE